MSSGDKIEIVAGTITLDRDQLVPLS